MHGRRVVLALVMTMVVLAPAPPRLRTSEVVAISFGPVPGQLSEAEDDRLVTLKLGEHEIAARVMGPSTKGNGALALPGLTLRIYDEHDDGLVYGDRQLTVTTTREWNGELFIEVSGTGLVSLDGKAWSTLPVPIRGRYRFDPERWLFVVDSESAPREISWTSE